MVIAVLVTIKAIAQTSPQEAHYEKAFYEISDLIRGNQKSFKKAVFLVENAFYESQLSEEHFNNSIKIVADVVRSINAVKLIDYDGQDFEKVQTHAAIFKAMTDSVALIFGSDTLVTSPFAYDFNDVFGQDDWTNMFITKLLGTNKGNCHSLPYLYKILAEELGETAYLSLAPNHIYIKLYNKQNGWYNTELTSASFPIDAWLTASGYIHLDAIRNGVYMDTLSQKESLALTLIDLAKGYERKFGVQDGAFMLKAANKALDVDPNFINSLLLKAETQKKLFEDEMLLRSIKDPNTLIEQSEEHRNLFLEMQSIYVKIHQLGYRQMPEDMYLDWLTTLQEEREKYQNKQLPIKQ
ncbi:MAG: hypothetical protein AAFW89_09600 [Bacteroidota bacterium]